MSHRTVSQFQANAPITYPGRSGRLFSRVPLAAHSLVRRHSSGSCPRGRVYQQLAAYGGEHAESELQWHRQTRAGRQTHSFWTVEDMPH